MKEWMCALFVLGMFNLACMFCIAVKISDLVACIG